MTTFAELASRGSLLVNDGYRTKSAELGEPGFPVLRVAEVGDGMITPTYGDHVRSEYKDKIGYKLSRAGDVLLTTKGTVGRRAIMPVLDSEFAYSPQLCFFRVLDNSIDRCWLYHWLGSPAFWTQAVGVSQQTDMAPYISLRDLRAIEIDVPPIDEQRAIAATLGALDDKIESNRRLATLTAALIDAAAAELLATAGESTRLHDVVEFNRLTLKPGPPDRELVYIDIASVSPGTVHQLGPISWSDAPSRARRGVADGDVIYSTVRPGRRSYAQVLDPEPRLVASTGFAVMSPSTRIGSSLLTTVAASQEFADYLESVAHGSAYPAVSVRAMGQFEFRLPTLDKVVEFESRTMPLRRRAHQAQVESERLTTLRDALLPELLSGRIRAPIEEPVA